MAKKKQYRQGDVFIEQVDQIPAEATLISEDPRGCVLALGEATGHHHRVGPQYRRAKMYAMDAVKFLDLRDLGGGGALVEHEEHTAIPLDARLHSVEIQREYQPDAPVQQVVD